MFWNVYQNGHLWWLQLHANSAIMINIIKYANIYFSHHIDSSAPVCIIEIGNAFKTCLLFYLYGLISSLQVQDKRLKGATRSKAVHHITIDSYIMLNKAYILMSDLLYTKRIHLIPSLSRSSYPLMQRFICSKIQSVRWC